MTCSKTVERVYVGYLRLDARMMNSRFFSLRLGQWFTADSICRYAADLSSIMEAIQIFCFVSYLKLDFLSKSIRHFSLSVPWVVVKSCAYHGGAAGPSVCSVCFSFKGLIKRCQ